jgi:hypothetical protein
MRKQKGTTHHFDPVAIRIQYERDKLHSAVRETLFERHAESLEARARLFDVTHGDCDVAESSGLRVARVVGRRVQRLCAVIMGELEDACGRNPTVAHKSACRWDRKVEEKWTDRPSRIRRPAFFSESVALPPV